MSFLHMSVAGAAMILAITVIRALAINRVPKKTFLALWGAALLRLLIPFSLPSRLSVYALLARKTAAVMPDVPAAALKADPAMQTLSVSPQPGKVNGAAISVWGVVWAVGLLACAAAFAVAYWKCYREFQTSLPVDNAACRRWLQAHSLRRAMTIRQSDRISSPLTFGMLRPVILMPKKTDWQDERTLQYVLEHEFVHIRRFDMLSKLLLIAAACVHWFNPLVWVMYVLANRDLELSCDESVVRYFGGGKRAAYANVLISMEETKSGFAPLCNHFSKNAIEERITAIMKIKKTTVLSLAAAATLVAGTVTAFATSVPIPNPNPNERAGAEAFAAGEGLKPRAEYVAVGITEKEKLWYYQGKPIAAIYDDNSGIYMDDKVEDGVYLNIKRGDNGSVTEVEVITRKRFRELVDRHMHLNPPESAMDEWSIISYVDAADGKRVLFPDHAVSVAELAVAGQADVALGVDAQRAGRGAGLLGAERIDFIQPHHRLIRAFRAYTADPALRFVNGMHRAVFTAGAAVDASTGVDMRDIALVDGEFPTVVGGDFCRAHT